jgi:hypothetical protein
LLTNHNSISFIGTIQEDGGTVKGTWENTDGTEGEFTIYMGFFRESVHRPDEQAATLSAAAAICSIKPSELL